MIALESKAIMLNVMLVANCDAKRDANCLTFAVNCLTF
jgi:hypothetical protein